MTPESTDAASGEVEAAPAYEPPRLTCLGTLAQLTQGGSTGYADADGDSGGSGWI